MHFLPVTFSLVASFLSAFTLLGMPAEVYTQGTQFLAVLAFMPVIAGMTIWVFIPVFHKQQVPSCHMYLELRFNHTVKLLTASLATATLIFFIAIVVYLPALALEQVAGINVDIACITIFMVCAFYTSVGGIKAVIWTDVFQLFFMFLSTAYILVVATSLAGGAGAVMDRNRQDSRLQLLNLSVDPRERHTVWGTVLGGGINWLCAFGVSQMQVQRYLTLPSIKAAQKTCLLTVTIVICLICMVGWLGLVLYAVYADCDPITAKQVRTKDQMMPLLVLHVAGDIPGLPGLFMAGIFSGSLSTISSGLNSLAAITLKDFMPFSRTEKMGEYKQAMLTKVFSLMYAVIGYGLTFLIRFMPGMLEAGMVIGGVVNGPILGMFLAGMLLPWVNSRGAVCGFIGSSTVTLWIAAGARIYKKTQPYVSLTSPPAPNATASCPGPWMEDWMAANSTELPQPLPGHIALYDISYIWYCALGASLALIISLLVTCLHSSQDLSELDQSLLAPCVPWIMRRLPHRLRAGWDDEEEGLKAAEELQPLGKSKEKLID